MRSCKIHREENRKRSPARGLGSGRKTVPGAERLLWILLFLIGWELLRRGGELSPLLFPSLKEIALALRQGFTAGALTAQIGLSLGMVCAGTVIGLFLAWGLSLAALTGRPLKSLTSTLAAVLHPLPGIALLPIIILWFGTGPLPILIIIIHSVLWPLYTNLTAGYRSLPESYLLTARNFEISPAGRFFRVLFPGSLPYLLAGLKIAWARAWRALISAEMVFGAVGGRGGLGWFIFENRVFMDTAGLFAGLAVVTVLGILVEDLLFPLLEKKTLRKWGMTR